MAKKTDAPPTLHGLFYWARQEAKDAAAFGQFEAFYTSLGLTRPTAYSLASGGVPSIVTLVQLYRRYLLPTYGEAEAKSIFLAWAEEAAAARVAA